MIFYCKATLNMDDFEKKVEVYRKAYEKYEDHLYKMEQDDMYKIQHADTVMEPPIQPKGETGYVKCNFRKDTIVGYEEAGSKILLMINFSMTGQGSYIIKHDDKIIKKLDDLLE